MNRRHFLKHSTATTLLSTAAGAVTLSRAQANPNDRIAIGVIGVGKQGVSDFTKAMKFPQTQMVAMCDVVAERRENGRKIANDYYAKLNNQPGYDGVKTYEDFRELLARDDLDAVMVVTPDHWHAIPVVAAAKAKKDIYCEKPISRTIAEGRAMVKAVQDNRIVFQTGSQQRSDRRFRQACELVRNGRIGKLRRVTAGLPAGRPDLNGWGARKKPEPIPDGFDYDFWLGPAPKATYCPARCFVNFRWIFDYSGGMVTDWGGHHPDIAQWGLGTERTGPVEIRNAKGEFPPDEVWNTATHFAFEAVFKSGDVLEVSSKARGGVTFEGADGRIWVDRGGIEAEPKSLLNEKIGANETHLYASDDHFGNFIDCILSRKETIAPAEIAHRSISICHLGNIAMRLGLSSLKWDPDKEVIIGNDEAARMLSYSMREPWKIEL